MIKCKDIKLEINSYSAKLMSQTHRHIFLLSNRHHIDQGSTGTYILLLPCKISVPPPECIKSSVAEKQILVAF